MAREVSVREATVVRAARALRFSGYLEFRTAFRPYFVERMSTVTRVRQTAALRRTESDVIDEVIRTDLTNLDLSLTKRRDSMASIWDLLEVANSLLPGTSLGSFYIPEKDDMVVERGRTPSLTATSWAASSVWGRSWRARTTARASSST